MDVKGMSPVRPKYVSASALHSEQVRACLMMCDPITQNEDLNHYNGGHSPGAEDENPLMSQSLVSLQAMQYQDIRPFGISRGRKRHEELTPVMPRERGAYAFSTGRIPRDQNRLNTSSVDSGSVKSTPKRAVSMTRLDQLAQPRRRYLEETLKSNYSLNSALSPTRPISSMSSSMDSTEVKRRVKPTVPRKPRPLSIGSPYGVKANVEDKVESRESRQERQALATTPNHPTVPMRNNRARSAGGPLKARPMSLVSPDSDGHFTPKPAPPRKPAHVKAAAMARKAAKQPEVADKPETKPTVPERHVTSSDIKKSKPTPRPEVVARKEKVKPKEADVKKQEVKEPKVKEPEVKEIDLNESIVEPQTEVEVKLVEPDVSKEVVEPEQEVTENVVSVPSVEPKQTETPPKPVISDNTVMPSNNNNKKEMSAEEYKKMMAERRRLAREQAEREAEAERLRIEKEKQEEEERIRREEEEQRKFEEEQLRLIEEQKRAEEERLRKAMEENRLREEEENRRKAEEQRLKQEREEKERRAKEEAERQRLELEERLKRDEEERLQRKKKLEAIMSRTRKGPQAARGQSPSNSPNETPEPQQRDNESNVSTPEKNREVEKNHQNILKNENLIIKTNGSDIKESKPDLVEDVDRAVLQNRKSEQNNGISHSNTNNLNNNNNHIQSFRNDNLVLVDNSQAMNESLDQLINLSPYPTQTSMEDVFNSNHNTSNAFIASNGSSHKNQEQAITDLLS